MDYTASILCLPNEILYMIHLECQPRDYESLMLSCKQTYFAGIPLLEDHNYCRKWPTVNISTEAFHITSVERFLKVLQQQKPKHQIRMLQSLRRARWSSIGEEVGLSMVRYTESLRQLEKSEVLREMTHDLRTALQSRDLIFEDEMAQFWAREPLDENITVLESQFYLILPLLLFRNVEYIQFRTIPSLDAARPGSLYRAAVPNMILKFQGMEFFQELREIHFFGRAQTLEALFPYLMLPKLRKICVDKVRNVESKPAPKDWMDMTSKAPERSRVERLLIFQAIAKPDGIEGLLKRVPRLKMFVWEDFTLKNDMAAAKLAYRVEEGEEEEGFAAFDHGQISQAVDTNQLGRHWTCQSLESDYDSDDIPDDELITEQLSLDNEDVIINIERALWDPLRLVNMLSWYCKHTLQRLSIMLPKYTLVDMIKRQDLIPHFKDFDRLTHLEYDHRIVRARRGRAPKGIPASLSSILPPTIQVVHIAGSGQNYDNLRIMLQKLPKPERKRLVPDLRDIKLIWDLVTPWSNQHVQVERWERLELLRHSLGEVGIAVGVEVRKPSGIEFKTICDVE
jgi:hypothetical protein